MKQQNTFYDLNTQTQLVLTPTICYLNILPKSGDQFAAHQVEVTPTEIKWPSFFEGGLSPTWQEAVKKKVEQYYQKLQQKKAA